MNRLRFFAPLICLWPLLSLILSACGQGPDTGNISTPDSSQLVFEGLSQTLTVTDSSGQPIAGARVLIGPRENVPFPGNLLTTNASGAVQIPTGWNDAQPVTVEAKGYVRATYFDSTPDLSQVSLRARPTTTGLELKGTTKGFGPLPKDGFLDVGLVFPALPRTQVALLDVMGLISPETDRLTIMGQEFDLPSNLTLPTQKETYIFPITFDKPSYRAYLPVAGTYRMVAAHARFPMEQTVDELRSGKSVFEVINNFEFRQASLKDVVINKSTQSSDLEVNQIPFVKSIPFTAPKFNTKFMFLAVSLVDQGGLYFPSDLKRFMPGERLTLTAPKQNPNGLVVAVLKRDDRQTTGPTVDEMSAVTTSANQSSLLDFLDVVAPPSLRAKTLIVNPPRSVSGVAPALTYAVLSKVDMIQNGNVSLEKKTPEWEIYSRNWASSIELPEMPSSQARPAGKFRWEVLFAGAPNSSTTAPDPNSIPLGPKAFEKVSHVTRSAFDL